jgi:hypothetical protein
VGRGDWAVQETIMTFCLPLLRCISARSFTSSRAVIDLPQEVPTLSPGLGKKEIIPSNSYMSRLTFSQL